ncbi:DNA primase [bacterium]|nr:DNA primase [bacterium]
MANDIVGVVQEYVALKRRGQNHWGLCPFHQENTPSFSVHPGKGIYRCFGCGKGGNVFSFLMEVEKLTFMEAVKALAERAHIDLPVYSKREGDAPSEVEQIVEANQTARDFFHTQLLSTPTPGARHALEYLTGRGFTNEMIQAYMIGYAPEGWEGLAERARNSRIPLDVFVKAGLLKIGQQAGRPYDVFRDRVMFPIRNLAGRVIAFGGRRMSEPEPGEPSAKYINSPETAAYTKGRELYGLWEARNEIRRHDRVILVEGYTDAISLASSGIRTVCASLGTALTEQQARLLLRFTPNVFILYDGDEPGLNAAKRAAEVMLSCGAQPRIVEVPGDEDPDSFVRAHGPDEVWALVNGARGLVEFQTDRGKRSNLPVAQIARELIASAALIPSSIDREAFLQEVSGKTGLSLDALIAEMTQIRRPQNLRETRRRKSVWPPVGAARDVIEALLSSPEIQQEFMPKLQIDLIKDELLRTLAAAMISMFESRGEAAPEILATEFVTSPVSDFLASPYNDVLESLQDRDLSDSDRVSRDRRRAASGLVAMQLEVANFELDAVQQMLRQQELSAERITELFRQYHDVKKRIELLTKEKNPNTP